MAANRVTLLAGVVLLAVARAASAEGRDDGPVRVAANRVPVAEAPVVAPPSEATPSKEERPILRREDRLFAKPAGTVRAETAGAQAASSAGWLTWMRSLGPLVVVLLVIVGLAALAKRFAPQRLRAGLTGAGAIEVLARQYLSPKQSVAMLKVGRRIVLVGMSPDRLTHLETIHDPDEVAELVGRTASHRSDSLTSTFQHEVLQQASAYDPNADSGDAEDRSASRAAAYAGTREQLRGLLQRMRSLTNSAQA
jgi:flagellar biosynthetic protein FliO